MLRLGWESRISAVPKNALILGITDSSKVLPLLPLLMVFIE